jgi:hypothetical protein
MQYHQLYWQGIIYPEEVLLHQQSTSIKNNKSTGRMALILNGKTRKKVSP